MFFKVLGDIPDTETIATGRGIRELRRLRKSYGGRRWRKLKGVAKIELTDGTICLAELHWYEAHGVGRKECKIKKILEEL
jgi:hypothetical protein